MLGSQALLGYQHTDETRARISVGLRGNTNSKGFKHTDETRAKLSAAGIGRKATPETRAKHSAASRRQWQDPTIRATMVAALGPSHETHGLSKTGAYGSWVMMMNRCYNAKRSDFHYYGGLTADQGGPITVCERWRVFETFLVDMGERPPGTTLSRYGDVGNYEPGNVVWHTRAQQGVERRKRFASTQGVKPAS